MRSLFKKEQHYCFVRTISGLDLGLTDEVRTMISPGSYCLPGSMARLTYIRDVRTYHMGELARERKVIQICLPHFEGKVLNNPYTGTIILPEFKQYFPGVCGNLLNFGFFVHRKIIRIVEIIRWKISHEYIPADPDISSITCTWIHITICPTEINHH